MDYGWDGNTFVDMISSQPVTGIYSGFFIDPGTQRYFYEQNYNSFFIVAMKGDVPIYQGNGQPTSLTATILTSLSSLSPYISDVSIAIQNKRKQNYINDPNNIISIQNTTPSAQLDTQIKGAIGALSGNQTVIGAIHSVAPFLSSSEISYALTDILENWVNGPDVIAKLSDFVNSHQENLDGINRQIKSIADFKKKLLRQQAMIGSKVGAAEGEIRTWENSNTFTMLASAFPGTFQPLVNSLKDHQSNSQAQLLNFMPSGSIDLNSTSLNVLNSLINTLFGSIKPRIISPIDKVLNDLNKLEGDAFRLADFLNINHYVDTAGGVNVANQFATLLDGILKKAAANSTPPLTMPPFDINELGNTLLQSVNQQANEALFNLIGSYSQDAATRTNSANPNDFTQIPEIAKYLTIPDPTMSAPLPSLTTDPVLQQSILQRQNNSQSQKAATERRHIKRGSGINILLAVDMTPPNQNPDGSDGDYSTETNYGV